VNNTGSLRNRFGVPVRYGHPGSSDILGVLPGGKFIAAEAKVGKDKPSAIQSRFLHHVAAAGGCAVVFYSLDELEHGIATYREDAANEERHNRVGGCLCRVCRRGGHGTAKIGDVA